ncbi:helix-turn-helix domain-containing protein [Myxococcota bacterium]
MSTRSSELTLVLEGELWLEMGPGQQYHHVAEGEACVVFAGTPHRVAMTPGTRFVIVDIPRERFPVEALGIAKVPTPVGVSDRAWEDVWQGKGAVGSLGPWVTATLERAPGRALLFEPAHNTGLMCQIKRELEAGHTAPVRVADIAGRRKLDTHYLIRAFRRNFGFTPLAYVQFLRREHFLWALMQSDAPHMLDLALDAGFNDYATFCRQIRGLYGRPPSRLISNGWS